MPTISASRQRSSLPFDFRADRALGANGKLVARAFGRDVEGVFSRTSAKWVRTDNGVLVPVARDVPAPERGGWAMEPARTNLVARSDDFAAANWTKTRVDVTSVPALSAYWMQETADSGAHYIWHLVSTFTANSVLAHSVEFRPGTRTRVQIRVASNAGANGFLLTVNLETGAVISATSFGTGTFISAHVEGPFPDGFLRLSVVGRVDPAATSGSAEAALASDAGSSNYTGDGASGLWVRRVQTEVGTSATSFIPTNGSTVARETDTLYFPFFLAPSTPMTVYHRQVHVGALSPVLGTRRFLYIGNTAVTGTRLHLIGSSADNAVAAQLATNAGSTASYVGGSLVVPRGAIFETRGVLRANGVVLTGRSTDGATEVVGTASGANAGDLSAYSDQRIYLSPSIASANHAPQVVTHVLVALGERTMDEMRALAGLL